MNSGWRKIPFLRWSFWRMLFGAKHLMTHWQVGDGREARLAEFVLEKARPGDPADAIRVIDEFGWNESYLINVGDEKGLILDRAVAEAKPNRILELGTYCGYSSLRMSAAAPAARVYSLEFVPENAEIARRIHRHAGVADRIAVVVGTLGDGGRTIARLKSEYGFAPGSVDLAFLDHAKEEYLPDLRRILEERWLRPGARIVADNVKFPGAPEYKQFVLENEGGLFRTTQHETHAEYQSMIKDLVLVSEYLGGR